MYWTTTLYITTDDSRQRYHSNHGTPPVDTLLSDRSKHGIIL